MQRNFLRGAILCLVPIVIAALLTGYAIVKYNRGQGGFRLGVDLVGGTILVYEIDLKKTQDTKKTTGNRPRGPVGDLQNDEINTGELASALKRRLDPDSQKEIVVRPVGTNRIEVILPTGGRRSSDGKTDVTADEVNKYKELIRQVGSLEFTIVANPVDDAAAIEEVQRVFNDASYKGTIDSSARTGDFPPSPKSNAEPYEVLGAPATYRWVEIGRNGRNELGVANVYAPEQVALRQEEIDAMPEKEKTREFSNISMWKRVSAFRGPGLNGLFKNESSLIYSRDLTAIEGISPERAAKKIEYYLLCRSSDSVKVGGAISIRASAGNSSKDGNTTLAVNFTFNNAGGNAFYDLTTKNQPTAGVLRQLAIVLDEDLISHPTLNAVIRDSGQITGNYTQDQVNKFVTLLRSGALPATLKGEPVSENAVSASLGADTVRSGALAIGLAFLAVLVFMVIYYQFAGLVASVALLANLLLTIGFMVGVNATFTLPGLAGLVLMLGMAVDANVLIYERLREERDRGASLAMAIRNAYDRAFPTIIDTHLSSIFTAVVLYTFGNDQLKGFGISLTVGLLISLFTSLYMTRLIFDFWMKKNWLKKLNMFRFLGKTDYNFMKIRKLMFSITLGLTIAGLSLFLFRGNKGLNVDFNGGTAYGGQLRAGKELTISEHRAIIEKQDSLAVDRVEKVKTEGRYENTYQIFYKGGDTQRIVLANAPPGADEDAQLENLKARASVLADVSVEQIFRRDDSGERSQYFTVRTTEKERELVQVAVERLYRVDGQSLLAQTDFSSARDPAIKDPTWNLKFFDSADPTKEAPTSISYVKMLIDREFRTRGASGTLEPFQLRGVGEGNEGQFTKMTLEPGDLTGMDLATDAIPKRIEGILADASKAFRERPQPERLETFDATLADETSNQALFAIAASWVVILVYLWFRFGNWTFGAAAVVCLIHDLCFTLGAIAVCHYLYDTSIGSALGLHDFKIDLPTVAALLTLVGYSVNDTIVVFDRIREVRGKSPVLTFKMINESVNQTLSRTILASLTTWLVVVVLYIFGGEGVHLFSFVMVVGVLVGTYSSIYIAAPLLMVFGEGDPVKSSEAVRQREAREALAASSRRKS